MAKDANPSEKPSRPAGAFSDPDLLRRVASALVLIPLAIFVAYLGGPVFAAFWCLAALAVAWEWAGLVLPYRRRVLFVILGLPLVLASIACLFGRIEVAMFLLVASAAAAIVVGLRAIFADEGAGPEKGLWAALGVPYAASAVLAPIVLRADAQYGFAAILWLFALVWGTDIAAYFAGRAIGGPKLWPRVSPKKTWSGALGGLIVGALAATMVIRAFGVPVSVGAVFVALVCSAVSQLGDLVESAMKRRFGVKDSGGLIPGHGGVMDRLDGFLFAAFAAAIIGICRGGWTAPASGLLVW